MDLLAFEQYLTKTRSRLTARRYCTSVRGFFQWFHAVHRHTDLTKAPRDTLQTYSMHLLNRGYHPGTVHSNVAGISKYLRWFSRSRGVVLPDFFKVELPKQTHKVKDTLRPEDLHHFFRLAGELEEPVRTAVLLLPCSGLRSEEMATVTLKGVRRVNFEYPDGRVKPTLTLLVKGKGGNERIVPLLDEGAPALVAYLKGWRQTHRNTEWLFPGRYSGHIATRTLRDAVQRVRAPLKLTFTPHTMRRTYLTALYRQGVDAEMLSKIAGSSVKVLIKHYLNLDENDIVNAVHSRGGKLKQPTRTIA